MLKLIKSPLALGLVFAALQFQLQIAKGSVFEFDTHVAGKRTVYKVLNSSYATIDQTGTSKVLNIEAAASLGALLESLEQLDHTGKQIHLMASPVNESHSLPVMIGREVVLRVLPGFNIQDVLANGRVVSAAPFSGDSNLMVVHGKEIVDSLLLSNELMAIPGVISAQPSLGGVIKKYFVPNDPFLADQWHLINTGQQGADRRVHINVQNVWDTYRGDGINVGVVDDGVENAHPDLFGNANTAIDYDYVDSSNDSSPTGNDSHGTAVSGIIGAVGNNGVGVTGVAFDSTLIGINVFGSGFGSELANGNALSHSNSIVHLKNNSWGYPIFQPQFDRIFPPGFASSIKLLEDAGLSNGIETGRTNLGTVMVFAAGNEGRYDGDANQAELTSSRKVITVGAVNNDGQRSSYSTGGASLAVSAPAGYDVSSFNFSGIVTTDRVGDLGYNFATNLFSIVTEDYTDTFNGTSAASPVVSGVVALILEANPVLGWRDVKEIILRSSSRFSVDFFSSSDWIVNASGINHSYEFGAGLANAANAVALAQNWTNLAEEVMISLDKRNLSQSIPDFSDTGITYTFDVPNIDFRVENLELNVDFQSGIANDIEIILTSPSGTSSILAKQSLGPYNGYTDWNFTTVRNWGEQAAGSWTLSVKDKGLAGTSVLNSVSLRLYGTSTEVIPSVAVATASVAEGNSGDSNALDFVLSLSQAVSSNVSVEYSLTPLSATAGQTFDPGADYVSVQGIATFVAGTTEVTIRVPVIPDIIEEQNEYIQLNLFNAAGANILQSTAFGVILNDDGLSVSISDVIGNELDTGFTNTMTFDVLLSQVHTNDLNISYAVVDGGATLWNDYTTTNGVLVITAGQTTGTILVDIIGDDLVETNETFTVYLTAILNDVGLSEGTLSQSVAVGTILDNESRVSAVAEAVTEGDGSSVNTPITVSLSKAATEIVTVDYYTTNLTARADIDFTSISGTIQFLVGETSQAFFVSILPDLINEEDEDLQVVFHNVSSAAALETTEVTVVITDNDALPVVSINDGAAIEGNVGDTNIMTFQVDLSVESGRTVAIDYQTSIRSVVEQAQAGLDYIAQSGRIYIQSGSTFGNIKIKTLGDNNLEANETFTVTISIPEDFARATLGAEGTQIAVGTINNDDAAPVITVANVSEFEGSGATVINVPVTIVPVAEVPITLTYSTTAGTATAGSDYTAVVLGEVLVAAGMSSAYLPVSILGDADEVNESFSVALTGADIGILGSPSISTVTILNDDGIFVSIADATIVEGNAGNTMVELEVSLMGGTPTGSNLVVSYIIVPGSATLTDTDYIDDGNTVTFDDGDPSPKTIFVSVVGDTRLEQDETFSVVLNAASSGTIADGTGLVTIEDDDRNANLAVELVITPTSLFVNHEFDFEMIVTNNGPEDAENVVLNNDFIAKEDIVDVWSASTIVTNSSGLYTFNFGTMTNGEVGTAHIKVKPRATGNFNFGANVDSDNPDDTTGDNVLAEVIPVAEPIVTLSKSEGFVIRNESIAPANGSFERGEVITLGITVENSGNVAATNVVITLIDGGGLTAVTSSLVIGSIPGNGFSGEVQYMVSVVTSALENVTATFQLTDMTTFGDVEKGTISQSFGLPSDSSVGNPMVVMIPANQGPQSSGVGVGSGAGSPNPSVINVMGRIGVVDDISVTLSDLSHSFPSDLDVLLVGPDGQSVVLMSDAIGGSALTSESLTFNGSASSSLPKTGTVTTGTYRPTDYVESVPDQFGYGGTVGTGDLSSFDGTDPNGDWSLYIWDDVDGDTGMLAGGWSISIVTVVPAAGSAGLGVVVSAAPQVFQGENILVTVTVSNDGPASATNVKLTNNIPSNMSIVGNAVSSQGAVNVVNSNLETALGIIASESQATVTYTLKAESVGPAMLSGWVYGDHTDLNLSNNRHTSELRINRVAALMVGAQTGLNEDGFQLMLAAPTGVTYIIESSNDLITWTPVVMGFITASFGGRPGMISGATGAIAVVVGKAVQYGEAQGEGLGLQFLFATIMMAGIIQVIFGLLKLGRLIRLVPHPVMMGFVNGLAIVILMAQFGSFKTMDGTWLPQNQLVIMGGLVALTMIIIQFFPKITKAVPSTLVAIVSVGLLCFFVLDSKTVSDVLLEGTGSGVLSGAFPVPHLPTGIIWNWDNLKVIFGVAFTVAMVGIIESLMTLQLIDDLTETRGRGNKECIAQGGANFLSGLLGGMGGCAMIGQSLINIKSGGRGRTSGIVAALALAFFIMVGGPVIGQIPVAALVGVMFMVVIGTFEWSTFQTFGRVPKSEILVILAVTLITVFMHNLALAVFAGVILSALVFAWESAKHVQLNPHDLEDGSRIYNIQGLLFFGSVREFSARFSPTEDPDEVIIDFKHAKVCDYSSMEALSTLTERYRNAGKRIRLRHLSPECQNMLSTAEPLVEVEVAEDDPHYTMARI
ncbi:S8 family serine peptidase [Verrucomicrobia bacterium]|nr:S8 family serine peptidase [Verrucomicrobiota bacterium]